MKLHILFYKYFQTKSLDLKLINNLKLIQNTIKMLKFSHMKDNILK